MLTAIAKVILIIIGVISLGVCFADGDDWILLDTEGNPYPCHETVFQKKYERI